MSDIATIHYRIVCPSRLLSCSLFYFSAKIVRIVCGRRPTYVLLMTLFVYHITKRNLRIFNSRCVFNTLERLCNDINDIYKILFSLILVLRERKKRRRKKRTSGSFSVWSDRKWMPNYQNKTLLYSFAFEILNRFMTNTW